jgi:hypothetical protein
LQGRRLSIKFGSAIAGLVSISWALRLPIDGREIWPMVRAHGGSTNTESNL